MPVTKKLSPSSTSVKFSRRSLLKRGAAGLSALQLTKLSALSHAASNSGLAEVWSDAFHIGLAISNQTLEQKIPTHLELIAREFSSVTAENAMKWEMIKPDNEWLWDKADTLVDFANSNNMYLLGHTLVWHSQVPQSVFVDAQQQPLSRTALLDLMQSHINTLVGRYKGRIQAWDVVNEALDEGNGWRKSPWFNIIGDDYMEQAFHFAHAADPNASLLYNDYNMHNPQKRAFLLNVLRDYLDRGVPIHGVGLQSHVGLSYPELDEWEKSIAAFAQLGLEVHITELDVDVLPSPYQASAQISNRFAYSAENDPYVDGLPAQIEEQLADRYEELFRILLKYRDHVKRVTMWGLHDGISWKNDFPISGRTNYPLLFDRNMEPKAAYFRLMELAKTI